MAHFFQVERRQRAIAQDWDARRQAYGFYLAFGLRPRGVAGGYLRGAYRSVIEE
jgi:hypothetical protein